MYIVATILMVCLVVENLRLIKITNDNNLLFHNFTLDFSECEAEIGPDLLGSEPIAYLTGIKLAIHTHITSKSVCH